jgi:drug/metabolite transporter (DMT)-like permease
MIRVRLSRNDGLLLLMTVIWGANYSIVKVALHEIPPLAFNSLRLGLASLLFLLTLALCRRARPVDRSDESSVGQGFSLADPQDRGKLGARAPTSDPGPRTSDDAASVSTPDTGHRTPDDAASVLAVFQRSRICPRDWLLIAVFGLIGHFVYQICFLFGLDRTTVANSSLILGCSPVVVALFSAALGHERVWPLHWIGAVLSVGGIYLVVGRGAGVGGASLAGDGLTICGLFCWGLYTVGAKGLLDRHSPLEVTGYSMAIGTVPYVLLGLGELRALDWRSVQADAWAALVFSAAFALFVAYLIWYTAVQRIGNIRTAMYSNVTPIAALAVAVLWLGEHLTSGKLVGAVAILTGMALTRLVTVSPVRASAPAEE